MKIQPEISGASIVILGSHNPGIFHPAWLFANEVEPKVSDELISLQVCHKDLAQFSINNVSYYVDQDRFQISTNSAPWIQLVDKASLIFSELLPHTPGTAVGINRDIHYRVASAEKRVQIGRALAPPDPWGGFGDQMNKAGEDVGGLVSLVMRVVEPGETYRLAKNVKIEPSVQLTGADGVYLQANFHFTPEAENGMAEVVSILQANFQARVNEAEDIFDTIMGL